MADDAQFELFSLVTDLEAVRVLLADLHDDLAGKVARFHQLAELSTELGSGGTMLFGGETTYTAWIEARTSFVHGNYVATVMLCQGMAEHLLAAHLTSGIDRDELPNRISFQETIRRCFASGMFTQQDAEDLRQLMNLRNPLSHFRNMDDPTNLSRRSVNTKVPVEEHLLGDATFAISMAIRLLALPAFRVNE